MAELDYQEKFLVDLLEKKGGKMNYKAIHTASENKFHGLRLILKKLKEKGLVTYEGIIPDLNAEIELLKKS